MDHTFSSGPSTVDTYSTDSWSLLAKPWSKHWWELSADVSCRKFTTHCMLFTLCFLGLEGRAITPLILAIQRQYPLELGSVYTLSQKNVPPLTCYNLDMHCSVTIIFGTSVTEKVGNQNILNFPTSPNLCFCTTWGNRKPEKCIFSLKCCMLFTKNTRTH